MALKSAQELSKLITAIGRIGKKIDEQIQVAAIQAIGYSIIHGDIRFGQQLFDNMPSGARRQALVTYLEKFGQFVWMSTEKKFNFYKRDDIEFDEEFLAGRKWYDEKKENIVSDIDVQAMVDKLIKRIESAIEKGGVNVKNAALLDEIKLASASYNSQFVEEVVVEDDSVTEDDVAILRMAA